jgi:hypothetical protein
MARGDVKSGIASVANNGFLTIQPGSTEEWVIHDLYHAAGCDVQITNGTDIITIESPTGAGQKNNRTHHLTNTFYMKIKNTSGSTAVYGYDGVQTKGT